MFDSLSMQFLDHQVITVSESTGLIHDVHTLTIEEQQTLDWSDDSVIDLREQTVLPGFVDAHVHCKRSTRNFRLHVLLKNLVPRLNLELLQCSCTLTRKPHGKIS